MKSLTPCFILFTVLTIFSQGKASDTYELKAELDLLNVLLREEIQWGNTDTEKLGDPLEQEYDERELQHLPLRTLSYVSDKRELLEDMAEEIEDDEDLQEEEREALLNNIDNLMKRGGGGCGRRKYRCPGEVKVCLWGYAMCNGVAQCPDGSDENESECDAFFANLCPINGRHFCRWRSGRPVCLSRDKMCDGRQNCADGSDENRDVCAAMPDCDDELYKKSDGEPRYLSCEGNNECIRASFWCDGLEECENGADESECEDDILPQQFLHAHNVLRAIHEDTPPVTWNEELADRAQLWADHLSDAGKFEHSRRGSIYRTNSGENIYLSSSETINPVRSIVSFYSEEYTSEYNYATGTGNGGMIGHFTQIVWDTSITIGCGVARGGGTYVVCQYSPPGNYRGAYPNRVHLPKSGMDPRTINEELRNSL